MIVLAAFVIAATFWVTLASAACWSGGRSLSETRIAAFPEK